MPLSLGLALLLLAPRPGDPQARADFVEALSGLEAGAGPRELDERAGKLALLPEATAAWLEIEAADTAGPAADGEPLTGAQAGLLDQVAAKLPRERVVETLRASGPSKANAPWRLAALKLLERHAFPEDLPLLVDLVREEDGTIAAESPLVPGFEAALTEVARRDVRLLGRMAWFAENAPALRPAFVRAIGASGDAEALPVLVRALGDRDLALPAMRQIARLAPKAAPGFRGELAARVRPFLEWSDEGTRRHAMRVLVALEDEESVPALLKIVENETAKNKDAEFAALRDLTGRKLPADAVRWRRWYDEERRWIEADAARAIERLASSNPGEVVAAMREIADRGLERRRLAEALAGVLRDHASAAVRNQACLALARLRSRAGLDALTAALSDSDPVVAGNAWNALRSISGLSLPLNATAWREALRAGT